jgi:hypothetical protein
MDCLNDCAIIAVGIPVPIACDLERRGFSGGTTNHSDVLVTFAQYYAIEKISGSSPLQIVNL